MPAAAPLRKPLPPFVAPAAIRGAMADALRPPRAMTVSETAELHRRINNPGSYVGPWRNTLTPYLTEIMDRSTSRACSTLVLVGPSQFGKTEVFLNIIADAAIHRPGGMLMFQPTKDLAMDFSDRRVELGLLGTSPDIAAELGGRRSDDKVFEKIFRNGTILSIAWPTASQFSSRPVPRVLIDERDRMPDDIDGEGDPVELGRKRTQTYGKNALIAVASSPSRPDGSGIVALYRAGDRRLWFWPCPECGEYFAPGFDQRRRPIVPGHLAWPEGIGPDEAREAAHLVCPECGGVVEEASKPAMNARGVWLAEGQAITAAGEISGAAPATRTGSYWFSGLASPFTTWGEIAEKYLRAEAAFEESQSEERLKTSYNTDFGVPYRSRSGGLEGLEPEVLEERAGAEGYALGTVPAGVLFLTAAVDVQAHRFAVTVKGWGENGESWLIDRFDILTASGSQTERIDPANAGEHWDALIPTVIARGYPLASDPARELPIATTAIDSGGLEGVTPLARDFVRRATAAGLERWRFMLVKGANTVTAQMLPQAPTFETDNAGKRLPGAVPLYVIGVHALKNVIARRLGIAEPGPGYIHAPDDAPGFYFREVMGERLVGGRWEKTGANESWDLEVYNEAARLFLKTERVKDWSDPPAWARPRPRAAAAPVSLAAPDPRPENAIRNRRFRDARRRGRVRGRGAR